MQMTFAPSQHTSNPEPLPGANQTGATSHFAFSGLGLKLNHVGDGLNAFNLLGQYLSALNFTL